MRAKRDVEPELRQRVRERVGEPRLVLARAPRRRWRAPRPPGRTSPRAGFAARPPGRRGRRAESPPALERLRHTSAGPRARPASAASSRARRSARSGRWPGTSATRSVSSTTPSSRVKRSALRMSIPCTVERAGQPREQARPVQSAVTVSSLPWPSPRSRPGERAPGARRARAAGGSGSAIRSALVARR